MTTSNVTPGGAQPPPGGAHPPPPARSTPLPLPPLPDRRDLADACRAVAQREGVQPWAVEKDFYLTRLLWALAAIQGDRLLLKGGTCLSKCDLGYRRLSEDVDTRRHTAGRWTPPRSGRRRCARR